MTQAQQNGTIIEPIYNGLNDRVAQVSGGVTTTFALDSASALPEVIYTSAGNAYLHLPGLIMTENISGAVRYLLTDGLGSVRQALDDTAAVVAYHEFDPYGQPILNSSFLISNYGFTGEWWQAEVGLLHLRARWYAPGDGVFLSKDAWEGDELRSQSLNGWSYVEGNPTNFTDPTGQWRDPTAFEQLSINLDKVWLVNNYKPQCCYPINPCRADRSEEDKKPDETQPNSFPSAKPKPGCNNKPLTGVTIAPNYQQFSSADDYMRYWLAWEIANPCNYRDGANCMGAALEVSKLYIGWSSPALVDDTEKEEKEGIGLTSTSYEKNGFMDPRNWPNWTKKEYFTEVSNQQNPGTIVTYTPNFIAVWMKKATLAETYYPAHMAVVTNHSTSEGPLCFEKLNPKDHYQLRSCSDYTNGPPGSISENYYEPTDMTEK